MKRVINFVKGKRDEKKESKFISPPISVEITNPAGQKVQSEDEHILGLQSGYGYQIDINGKDKNLTKLHKAAWQGNLEKVKVHLKKTDVNLVDHLNRTALHFAAAQGHSNVAWFLLNAKASFDIRDSDGMTPFLKAIECGNKECVNMLLEKGADVNFVDRNGNNGLHFAAKLGFFNIASLLLKSGANFDCSNNVGEFPLHLATEGEHRELVELLLHSGAHVNVIDRDNRTPLMLAARYGLTSFVSLFLEHNASLEACDSNGWTAEDYALIGGHQLLAADLKVPNRDQMNKETEQLKLKFHFFNMDFFGRPLDFNLINFCEFVSHAFENGDMVNVVYNNFSKAFDQAQEIIESCETANEVDFNTSENGENIPQTAEVEINAEPSKLKHIHQSVADSVESFIDNDEIDDGGCDKKEDADTIESPRSCVTPPPLQPPRSWDLIQAGMIDEKEVQRRSLTVLGTLRSRRESFNENNGGTSPHSPHKGQGDFLELDLDENLKSKTNRQKIVIDSGGDANSIFSEESLPLDKLPSTPDCHENRPRSRLERAPSVDLTEEDPSRSKDSIDEKLSSDGATLGREDTLQGYEEIWEKNDNIINVVDNLVKDNNISLVINTNSTEDNNKNTVYDTGQGEVTTEISDQYLQMNKEISNSVGYVTNEIYRTMIEKPNHNHELVSNTQFIDSNINQPMHVSSSLDNLDDYKPSFIEIESSRSCNNLDDKYMALEENLCCGIYSSDTITDITGPNENEGAKSLDDFDMSPPLGTVVKRNICREVHSLDMLDGIDSCSGIINDGSELKPMNKKHARNKSVSVNSRCWSKSFDVLSKPSNIDKVQVDTKKIDAQLECYDEALRELAQDEILKRNSLSRSSKDSFSSSERKSETLSLKSGYLNSNDSYAVDKGHVSSLVSGSSLSGSQQITHDYFLKLNDNKDFKINQDPNNIPDKIIDKSKSVDSISTDSSEKFNKSNFIEDYNLKSNDVKTNLNDSCKTNIETIFDVSLQDLPPPPPELTFNPNISSENDNVYPLTRENVDFLMKQNVDARIKCQEKINVNNNNEGDDSVIDEDDSSIAKKFENSLFKLEKDLYNINTSIMKPFDEKISNKHIVENHIVVLPVECSTFVGSKTEIPVESRNGHFDVEKNKSPNFNVNGIIDNDSLPKHGDDDSSSAMDRSAEEESPKLPPRQKKCLRKGRSEGEMRNIISSRNTRSYSASTYNDIINDFILDKSSWLRKKSEAEAPMINEKSESDSELCERPLRRKRKILLAMRGVVAGSKDSDEDEDTSAGDPPFWLSTERGGHFARQDTVVSMPQSSRPDVKQNESKQDQPRSASSERERIQEGQSEGEKPWTSSDGETASGSGDVTPGGRHSYTIRSHHTMLKEHLRNATNEKTILEETVANLREQLERINYELADALQAIASKDDCISILEAQVKRLEFKYSTVLDEYQTIQHHVTTQEVELKHLREHCEKLINEKAELGEQLENEQKHSESASKCTCIHDERKKVQEDILRLQASKKDNMAVLQKRNQEMEKRNEMLVAHLEEVMRQYETAKKDKEILESQNIADIKKLQQDTLIWKDKYEDCHAKLERVDMECRPRLEEAERTIVFLQSVVQKLEAEKKHDQENWKSKFMDELALALEDIRREYEKAELLLNDRIKTLERLESDDKSRLPNDSKELCVLWKSKSVESNPVHLEAEVHKSKSLQTILSPENKQFKTKFSSKNVCGKESYFDPLTNSPPCKFLISSHELLLRTSKRIFTRKTVTISGSSQSESISSRQKSVKILDNSLPLSELSVFSRSSVMCINSSGSYQCQQSVFKSCYGTPTKKCLTVPVKLSFKCHCNDNKHSFTDYFNAHIKEPSASKKCCGSVIIKSLNRDNIKEIRKSKQNSYYKMLTEEEVIRQIMNFLIYYNIVLTYSERSDSFTLHCQNVKINSPNNQTGIRASQSYSSISQNNSEEKSLATSHTLDRHFWDSEIAKLNDTFKKTLNEKEMFEREEDDTRVVEVTEQSFCKNSCCLKTENDNIEIQLTSEPNSNKNKSCKKKCSQLTKFTETISFVPSSSGLLKVIKCDKVVQVCLDEILIKLSTENFQSDSLIKEENFIKYIRESEKKFYFMESELNKLIDENNKLKEQLNLRKNQVSSLMEENKILKNQLTILEDTCNRSECLISKEKWNIHSMKKQLFEYKIKINDLVVENNQLTDVGKRVDLLNDILEQTKNKIIDDEERIKDLLHQLSNMSDLYHNNSELKSTVIQQQNIINEMNKQMKQLQLSNLEQINMGKHSAENSKLNSEVIIQNNVKDENIFMCCSDCNRQFIEKNYCDFNFDSQIIINQELNNFDEHNVMNCGLRNFPGNKINSRIRSNKSENDTASQSSSIETPSQTFIEQFHPGLSKFTNDKIPSRIVSHEYLREIIDLQQLEYYSKSDTFSSKAKVEFETPSKLITDIDSLRTNSMNFLNTVANLKNHLLVNNRNNDNAIECSSNHMICLNKGEDAADFNQILNPFACFFFSTLPFDPLKNVNNNLSTNKSSVSSQSFDKLQNHNDHLNCEIPTELLYKRYGTGTSTSGENFSNPSYTDYTSFLPVKVYRSQSACSLKSSYRSGGLSDKASVLTMAFLIPVEDYCQYNYVNDNLSNTVSNKGDSSQNSENDVVFPNTTVSVDVMCQVPSSSSVTFARIEPQLEQLQQRLESESGKRQSLELQVNKLIVDLQEKLVQNRCSSQKNVLSNQENQEVAVGRMRQQALLDSENNLSEKISQINTILQQQMEEQDRLREHSEMQMKKEFEQTRQKLLFELSKVQTALKAKEAEERRLREKCDKLTRDVEKSAELKRKQLLEKSYSINLAQRTGAWEKELSKKQNVVVVPPPPPLPLPMPVISTVSNVTYSLTSSESPFSHDALRAQLHDSIMKHRDVNLDEQPNIGSASGSTQYDDRPETSSKR